MRIKIMALIVTLMIVTAGCANTNEEGMQKTSQDKPDTHPISYENEGNQKGTTQDNAVRQQERQERINSGQTDGNNVDIFTTEEAADISHQLRERTDVSQAQVATTKDRVIIGVMLSKNAKHFTDDQQIIREIEQEVSSMIPEKEVVVYTDDAHWNQMKDLNAKAKQSNAGENIEDYIEKFLNIDVKD